MDTITKNLIEMADRKINRISKAIDKQQETIRQDQEVLNTLLIQIEKHKKIKEQLKKRGNK